MRKSLHLAHLQVEQSWAGTCVYNERGSTVLLARVTARMARGAVSIKEGAWFTPDAEGMDVNSCQRTDRLPLGACRATTHNINLVEVERLPQ